MSDLTLPGGINVPERELQWRFGPSGGPGGQHANRAATRAELSFDLAASSAFDDAAKAQLQARLGRRLVGGVVTVIADESRSQWRNRVVARRRLAGLLAEALRPRRPRVATAPSRGARRRRLASKRARGELKRLRRPPDPDDG
jgi:ribosome-associated protein